MTKRADKFSWLIAVWCGLCVVWFALGTAVLIARLTAPHQAPMAETRPAQAIECGARAE